MKTFSIPACLAALLSSAAAQTTIRVPGDVSTIQGAIALAQDGDTVLVAPGTYPEFIDYLGKAIVVASEGGASVTTIDATGLFEPVVSFHANEGPGSVLRGFTVTGGRTTSGRAGGISATLGGPAGATPRIEACVIRGNTGSIAPAGGVSGSATLEDCVIEGNSAWPAFAGGVWGAAVLRRCIVRNNTGYDAGGLYLDGGRAEDCIITGNLSQEGTYGGGAFLAGPDAVLERCLVAGNSAQSYGQYAVSSAGVYGYSATTAPLVLNCTIADNIVVSPYVPPGENCGGVQGFARLVNTIVRGNDEQQLGTRGAISAAFSNIQGGHPGPGNFDADPLFVAPASGDYHLSAGSPCIDAGALLVGPDPDGTRADVGAFFFPQAGATVRNGRGLNPLLLSSLSPPAIGTTWTVRIDSSLVPGATQSIVTGHPRALEPGIVLAQGELLVAGPQLFSASLPSSGGFDDFAFPIPNRTALLGFQPHVQGVVLTPSGHRLGNALALFVGH